MMSALIQGLLMRVAMSIMMIALLQKHIVVCEHVSTSYLAEQEKLNPLSLETAIVLPNGKSTSASLTNRKESSSLSKSKYNSEYNEKPRDITSYRTVLTTSRVDWKDEKKHHMNQSNGKDANDRSNASDNDINIKPFQEELTFVVSTSRQASQTSYDSMKSGPVDYTIFDKHMNDPDFQLNPKNTILVVPLVQNSEFKHLSALCDKSGTGASNDANSRKDKERSTHPPSHGVNQGDGPDGYEASATDMNHKIKGRFRLTSYLLDFSWSDVTDVSGAYEKDQVERSKENEDTVWIASCPKNIICMEKQGQWFLSKSSSSSATSTPPPTGSTPRPHVQINTDYDKTSDKNFSSDSATMTNDFITKSPPTTKPTKRLVKVSKSEAFSLAYECHTIQKFRDTGESRVESGDESNVTTVLFTLDIFSAIKAWLSKHSNCQLEFSRSFVFSLKIDEIVDDDVMTLPLPSSNNGLQTSSATEFSELFSHNGKEHAVFSLEYTIDARCALPVSEACPVGKCSSADYIYKFRPECSPAKTVWNMAGIMLFTLLVMSSSTNAQGWDRRFGRSGSGSKRSSDSSRICDTHGENETILGTSCNFDEPCLWEWEKPAEGHTGFRNMTPMEIMTKMKQVGPWEFHGPTVDTKNKTDGHFLILAWENSTENAENYTLTSPWFRESNSEACHLEAYIHMHNMQTVMKVVIESNVTTFVPLPKLGNDLNTWERHKQMIGRVKEPFRIVLEVDNNTKVPSHFAIDDIRLVDCFPSNKTCKTSCSDREFQCSEERCIDRNRLCDLGKDCMYGEDEEQDCGKVLPHWNGSCTFETDWCGWHPVSNPNYNITWERTSKPSPKSETGPKTDHTYNNSTGFYLLVDMKVRNADFHRTVLRSPVYAHPPAYNQNSSSPYYQSCQLRFFYHMFGSHIGSLDVELVPKTPRNPWTKPYRFCERSGNQGNIWRRASCKIPSFKGSKKYYLQLTAIRGARGSLGDIAIDDISLSPECFGIGVPLKEKGNYDYEAILNSPNEYPGNLSTAYKFSTCNNTGRSGPSQEQCDAAYNGTLLENEIKIDSARNGVQIWHVPESKSYTLIAKGASGGRGALLNQMTSHGSIVKTTMLLRKGEKIYILVGQEGISGCGQAGSYVSGSKRGDLLLDRPCTNQSDPSPPPRYSRIFQRRRSQRASPSLSQKQDPFGELSRLNRISRGGGGGGGATIIYKMNGKLIIPILIAAGGGGLGYNASANIMPHGRGLNVSLHPHSGYTQAWGAGGGGGWEGATPNVKTSSLSIAFDDIRRSITAKEKERDNATMLISAGLSHVDGGGLGGFPCEQSDPWGAAGGFGGGGGGCIAGGGGGGYVGGNAFNSLSANGEGGWSYIGKGGLYPSVEPGGHSGPGEFLAIPSFAGCDCEYACVLIDDFDMHTGCVCPENSILRSDGSSCVGRESFHAAYMVVLIVTAAVVFCLVAALCFCLYNRYQKQKMNMMRRKKMGGTDLQLSRLRAASGAGGVLTEYNPNYEFGGETYTLTDLKEIPRENLRLVKALGQGAFGEVYQGFYRHRDGDAVEMPVAVKTLPALSSNQAEMDFLMEALIMSKFNHPNIVHFIGVCFDKHPRFIILELLAGGDLKSFLRESRPKPDKASPLTMRDLLLCAMDVAKGCKYLEDNHFIHRDIAARNCLLTTKGPGRVVKIADFGMARDIYRADYYKKGGKAMLPVKWMPPEAFLDGIFTSKTDVWSYGVLLWEIFSLGYMPYPGRGNQDVMQLITNGGRLEPPSNCPPPVYGIMTQCWHPIPDERPTFSTLLERVGYCLQDPEVVNAPLPVFQRPPSSERDTTLMRPPNPESGTCLRIQAASRYSISTTPDLASPNSSTADYLVPLTHYSFSNPASPPPRPDSQPTSPTTPQIPESESTETMLDEEEPPASGEQLSNSKDNTKYADITVKTGSSNSNNTNSSKPNVNGIDTGVTLSAAGLEKLERGSGAKRPAQYANVGVSKPRLPSPVNLTAGGGATGGDPSDEEIRC